VYSGQGQEDCMGRRQKNGRERKVASADNDAQATTSVDEIEG
jgi:hypothetical protein